VTLAVASAVRGEAVPAGTVVLGEVGLAGDLRRVPGTSRRLAEAARLGFTRAIVARDDTLVPEGMQVRQVSDVGAAVSLALDAGSRERRR
jgi:DNA repair protein RadA/Sms